jgi:hypothetical protein
VDVDDAAAEVVLLIHWKGGAHSELRFRADAAVTITLTPLCRSLMPFALSPTSARMI